MNKNAYPGYGLALLAGGALAIWLGFPPALLLILLVCPLMMFFMMRGMHGGQDGHSDRSKDGYTDGAARPDQDKSRPGQHGSH